VFAPGPPGGIAGILLAQNLIATLFQEFCKTSRSRPFPVAFSDGWKKVSPLCPANMPAIGETAGLEVAVTVGKEAQR